MAVALGQENRTAFKPRVVVVIIKLSPGVPPALRVVHEEQVEQSVSSIRQPGELVLQVVVRLLPQAVLTDERQLRETLQQTRRLYEILQEKRQLLQNLEQQLHVCTQNAHIFSKKLYKLFLEDF